MDSGTVPGEEIDADVVSESRKTLTLSGDGSDDDKALCDLDVQDTSDIDR